jgi:anti-anti-sigma factor
MTTMVEIDDRAINLMAPSPQQLMLVIDPVDSVPEAFSVEVSSMSGRCVVTLSGELDMAAGPALRSGLARALESRSPVVIDCASLTFIDGRGIQLLIKAIETSHRVRLTSVPSAVARTFSLPHPERAPSRRVTPLRGFRNSCRPSTSSNRRRSVAAAMAAAAQPEADEGTG